MSAGKKRRGIQADSATRLTPSGESSTGLEAQIRGLQAQIIETVPKKYQFTLYPAML